MSDGYDAEPAPLRHGRWRMHSSPTSLSSHTASSRPPSSETYDEDDDDEDSMIVIPPNVPAFNVKRHLTAGNPTPTPNSFKELEALGSWRGKENKLKTVHAALVLCLNIGVDPPDVVKTNPCAVLECWIDPFSLPPSKALEAIGKNLVHQFETLNPRMRYKQYPDPSVDDTRRFCIALRKMVKDERALFYYNGHGVPKPTASGEIWVFNRGYTQYIPVSLQDLQGWLGSPTIYVWDCSAAGHILDNFEKFAKKRDQDFFLNHPDPAAQSSYAPFMDSIHVAACAADEVLPMSPDLPADVFTSALTSPIEMALRFYVLQNQPRLQISIEDAMKIPGDLKDRRTPLGELNWIFTAVTDTIAWTTFPTDLFKRLFRQDWTLAALFRNFLLAERIMRKYNCTPRAFPALPPAHMHPLWLSWDLAVDKVMVQLPNLLAQHVPPPMDSSAAPPWQYENVASVFFEEHLQAFFVWLNRGGSGLTKRGGGPMSPDAANLPSMTPPTLNEEDVVLQKPDDVIASTTGRGKPNSRQSRDSTLVPRKPPDQLPILLQVLLSQTHRLRALILLGNFIDLGPWAVHLALTIGIFPYVQKLLQSPALELRPVLTYIWTRVIAFDQSIQVDLLKDNGHTYFATLLKPDIVLSIPNEVEHKAMCAFIMAIECRDHPTGQQACFQIKLFQSCIGGMESGDYLMRQWSALAMALLWDGFDEAKTFGIEVLRVHKLLEMLITDDAAEVRAAVFYALGTLFGASASTNPEKRGGGGMGSMLHLTERDHLGFELKLGMGAILTGKDDASPMVRKEVAVLLSTIVFEWRGWFIIAAWAYWEGMRPFFDDKLSASGRPKRKSDTGRGNLNEPDPAVVWAAIEDWIDRDLDDADNRAHNHLVMSSVFILYATLLDLTVDPYTEVANMARTIADWVMALLKDSPFARLPGSTLQGTPASDIPPGIGTMLPPRSPVQIKLAVPPPTSKGTVDSTKRSLLQSNESTLSTTLKRTSSIASSIRNLATGYAFPTLSEKEHPEDIDETDEHQRKRAAADPHPPRFEYRALIPEPRFNFTPYVSPYVPRSEASENGAVPRPTSPARNGVQSSAASLTSSRSYSLDRSSMSAPTTPRRRANFTLSSGRQTPSSGPETSPEMPASMVSFSPADVIEALVEEDWERLRVRRRAGILAKEQQAQILAQQQYHQRQQQLHPQQVQSQLPPGTRMPSHLSLPPQTLSHLAQQHPNQPHALRSPPLPGSQRHPPQNQGQVAGVPAPPMHMPGPPGTVGNGHGNGQGSVGHPGQHPHARGYARAPSGNGNGTGIHSSWTSSSSSFVTTDSDGSGSQLLSALATGSGLPNVLPLKSMLFDFCMEYFTEPQMRADENEEPGSVVYNEQSWRVQRNERIILDTRRQSLTASGCHWDKNLITLQNNHPVRTLKFHQFETHLITSNNDRLVSVWDWAKRKRLACFDNGNPEGTSVTSLHFLNEDAQPLILTASADGMVRIFNNYDPETAFDDSPLALCSAFRALRHLSFSEYRSGTITDWLQPYGLLVVGGDSKTIRIWDVHKETVATDIPTDMGSCVTAISSDLDGATLVLAGTGDGTLAIYDRRTGRGEVPMKSYSSHRSWIQNVHWQRGCNREIISGSLDGVVTLWDIRSPQGRVMDWEPHAGGGLSNLAVHDHTGVFATTSASGKGLARNQSIIVQSLPPLRTPVITHLKVPVNPPSHLAGTLPNGFFPSPGSLAFHPHEMIVGWGGYDGRIKLFGCNLSDPTRVQEPEPVAVPGPFDGFESPLPSITSTSDS